MKITLIRKDETLIVQRTVKLETVLENMKTETKTSPVTALRRALKFAGGSGHIMAVDKLPRIYFSVEMGRKEEVSVMKAYHGLILLNVRGLAGFDEAVRLRDKLAGLPQTMITFVGSSGRSVKILVPFLRPDGSLPATVEEARLFHAHAYQWAVNFYRGQLLPEHRDITLENPVPEQSCRYSFDPGLFFNPDVYPIRLEQPLSMPEEVTYRETVEAETDPLQRMMPGYERSEIISTLFETSLYEALNAVDCDREEGSKLLIVELTRNCFRSGIPEEEVVGWTLIHFRGKVPEILVRETVHNVYTVEKRFGSNPCISPKQTMAVRTDEFMGRRYEFRYNTLAGVVEYRERKTFCFNFRPVTDRVLNTIAVNAISEGLELWDRDVKRWINSERVPIYSPITDFLYSLPRWDGKDRIRALASYVPCDNSHWPDFFHRWFLSMVAHWKGNDKQYANSVSPLLIGAQGCGKSTYCRNLLPPDLRAYYTDSIDFSRKRDAELYLNRFMLINMDEFDQVSANHQGFLKHILQKPVLNVRKPNESAVSELKRYASFIATSNQKDLLTDPSGSRRFMCVEVTGTIDTARPIDYEQLYAQAMYEIYHGERYWFDDKDEAILTQGNREFEQTPPAIQLFYRYFKVAGDDKEGEFLSPVEILDYLQKRTTIALSSGKAYHFGRLLQKEGIPCKHTKKGTVYRVVKL